MFNQNNPSVMTDVSNNNSSSQSDNSSNNSAISNSNSNNSNEPTLSNQSNTENRDRATRYRPNTVLTCLSCGKTRPTWITDSKGLMPHCFSSHSTSCSKKRKRPKLDSANETQSNNGNNNNNNTNTNNNATISENQQNYSPMSLSNSNVNNIPEHKQEKEEKKNNQFNQTIIYNMNDLNKVEALLSRIMPGDSTIQFEFNLSELYKAIPWLSNYEQFVQYQGESPGDSVIFLYDTKTKAYTIHGESETMTVSQWDTWFQDEYRTFLLNSPNSPPKKIIYLTNILPAYDQARFEKEIRRLLPVVNHCDENGKYCQLYWMRLANPETLAPDMTARFYLNPPVRGWILTAPHYDGAGTQMSLHSVLGWGLNNYNLVQSWPLRSIIGIETQFAEITETENKTELPHDKVDFSFAPIKNDNVEQQTTWHSVKQRELMQMNCRGEQNILTVGNTLELPPYTCHTFLKANRVQTNAELAKEPPMIGLAGDSSFITNPESEYTTLTNHLLFMYNQQFQQRINKQLTGKIYGLPMQFVMLSAKAITAQSQYSPTQQRIATLCLPLLKAQLVLEESVYSQLPTLKSLNVSPAPDNLSVPDENCSICGIYNANLYGTSESHLPANTRKCVYCLLDIITGQSHLTEECETDSISSESSAESIGIHSIRFRYFTIEQFQQAIKTIEQLNVSI